MRLWAHVIWLKKNPTTPLALCGPKEDRKLEWLISQQGEQRVAYAWYLYVNAKPAPYNLKAVKHVDKFTTKNGNIMAKTVRDTGAITRFPLSAFLAVADGFIVQSCLHIDAWEKAYEATKAAAANWKDGRVRQAHLAIALGIPIVSEQGDAVAEIMHGYIAAYQATKATTASIKPVWGVTQKDLENDVMDEF